MLEAGEITDEQPGGRQSPPLPSSPAACRLPAGEPPGSGPAGGPREAAGSAGIFPFALPVDFPTRLTCLRSRTCECRSLGTRPGLYKLRVILSPRPLFLFTKTQNQHKKTSEILHARAGRGCALWRRLHRGFCLSVRSDCAAGIETGPGGR